MTEDIYDIDYETRSAADLKKVGAARYAEDDTTKILMFAISKNGSEPIVWDMYDSDQDKRENPKALKMLKEAISTGSRIYAHNYQFEHFISKYNLKRQLGIDPPAISQWRCTAAMARRAAIPFSLEKCAEFLELDIKKDKVGGMLINLFSMPKKDGFVEGDADSIHTVNGEKLTATDAWLMFMEYCRQDVRTQIAIRIKLPKFDMDAPKQHKVLASFQSDGIMNDRGVPVNVEALKLTQILIDEYQGRVGDEFRELTGYNYTQNVRVKEWLQDGGYPEFDLQAATIEFVLKKKSHVMDSDALRALKLLQLLSFAALAKVPAMIRSANSDNKVRGSLLWAGALRTHRWTGKIIQPQNMRRPTIDNTELAYDMMQCPTTTNDDLEMLWGSPLEAIASCIRHFIQYPDHKLFDVDYSNIEARILSWLAGDKVKLGRFADPDTDVYKVMAAAIFDKPVEDVTKAERFVGKTAELGLGYRAGYMAFSDMLDKYDYNTPEDEVETFISNEKNIKVIEDLNTVVRSNNYKRILQLVKRYPLLAVTLELPRDVRKLKKSLQKKYKPKGSDYREITRDHVSTYLQHIFCKKVVELFRNANPNVVSMWEEFDKAAKDAVANEGSVITCASGRVHFKVDDIGFKALIMRLPSGHCLVYPKPEMRSKEQTVEKNGKKFTWDAEYVTYEGQLSESAHFGRVSSYSGKWVENACQAIGGDFLSHGLLVADEAGYETFAVIHDQALAPVKDGLTLEGYTDALCTLPDWAEGFPLAGDGGIVDFYTKD